MAQVDMNKVHTNIAYIKMQRLDIMDAHQFVERMAQV